MPSPTRKRGREPPHSNQGAILSTLNSHPACQGPQCPIESLQAGLAKPLRCLKTELCPPPATSLQME